MIRRPPRSPLFPYTPLSRSGLEEMGFPMLSPVATASPVTTAAYGIPGMNVPDYMGWLLREHRIRIGGGLGELSGKIFRVGDRKSTRLNSSHLVISYAVFCLK